MKLKNAKEAGFEGRDGWQPMFEIHANETLTDRYPIQIGPAKVGKLVTFLKLNGVKSIVSALEDFVKKNPPKTTKKPEAEKSAKAPAKKPTAKKAGTKKKR